MVIVTPGETIDVLMTADAPPAHYHMVALANQPPEPDPQIPVFVSRGLVRYAGGDDNNCRLPVPVAVVPVMPDQHNTMPSYYFHGNLTGLAYPELLVDAWAGVAMNFGFLFFVNQHANRKSIDSICMLA